MKLLRSKNIDNRLDNARPSRPQNQQAKGQGGIIKFLAEETRNRRERNERQSRQIKEERSSDNSPKIPENVVREEGSEEGCRVGYRNRN